MTGMLLTDLVATHDIVRATRSRTAKVAALADLLVRAAEGDAEEVEVVTTYLAGVLRQRRTGLGWRGLSALPDPAPTPSLDVLEVDAAFEEMATLSGPGSQGRRVDLAARLFGRATAAEQAYLRGLVTGDLRQGALDALVVEALAAATGTPVAAVRRAVMLAGATAPVSVAVLTEGETGLGRFALEVGRPVRPMLASSAPDVDEALARLRAGGVV